MNSDVKHGLKNLAVGVIKLFMVFLASLLGGSV